MKLRNKKTGKIIETEEPKFALYFTESELAKDFFTSIKQLTDTWEDYTPQEPLIKDEKIRKAVRAWADALDFKNDEHVFLTKPEYHARVLDVEKGLFTMSIPYDEENIEDVCNLPYTITELCGEGE